MNAAASLRTAERVIRPQSFRAWTNKLPHRLTLSLPLAPTVVFTSEPEDCRAVFTARDGTLLFGEGLKRLAPHEAMFGADALRALDGPDHTRFRRQLTAAFHGEALRGYEARITEVAERHVASWPVGSELSFAQQCHALARDVITAVVFGITDPGRAARLNAALERLDAMLESRELAARFLAAILLRGRWAPYPKVAQIHAEIAAVAREEIAQRRGGEAGEDAPDCLARFLRAQSSDDAEERISDEELITALHVLVVAGWATTANTLAWMAERLTRAPDALAGCIEDVRAGGSRYLSATVIETLRMRPPVPITVRYVARDFQLGAQTVKRGSLLAVDIERIHYRPDIYEEPERFNPERFIDGRPGTYTWLPFGGGVHRCIGAGFALTEARLILAAILRSRTFVAIAQRGEGSHRRTLITAPAAGAQVTLAPAP